VYPPVGNLLYGLVSGHDESRETGVVMREKVRAMGSESRNQHRGCTGNEMRSFPLV
jgi:hypothetical protein